MVTRCAPAAVLFEADQVTGTAVLARIREADVTLGQDLRVSAVCQRSTNLFHNVWKRTRSVKNIQGGPKTGLFVDELIEL